jgi:DNA-binding NtrC family response regulator
MRQSPSVATVLVVDDDPKELRLMAQTISSFGYNVETASDGEEALSKIGSSPVSVILTDLIMPRVDGFELLRTLKSNGQMVPAIVLTAFGSITQAVSIVHELGAFWFLEKPAQVDILAPLLDRAIQYGALMKETASLQRQLSYQGVLGELVGTSKPMQQIYSVIQRVAPTHASVLITGESGTGKEMVARTIHRLSPRVNRPFIAINCAALPQELIESELFGHEKGAFTGATGQHAGCFEQANGGTLLLDEIGEMPQVMQARLLRVLEECKVRRLGGTAEIPVDVRILASTNREVGGAIENKVLREDLFYRLNVFHLHLPPLRARLSDIPQLTEAIIRDLNQKHQCHVTRADSETLDRLMHYSWPGNVRELRNVLEWAVITAGKGELTPLHLPKNFGIATIAPQNVIEGEDKVVLEAGKTLAEIESTYILPTLQRTNNDRKRTARLLGISLRTLHNRLSRPPTPETRQAKVAQGKSAS